MRFSERHKYKKVREIIQFESIDEPLKNALWSLLEIYVWRFVDNSGIYGMRYLSSSGNEEQKNLCEFLWLNYFKKPLDTLSDNWDEVLREDRKSTRLNSSHTDISRMPSSA